MCSHTSTLPLAMASSKREAEQVVVGGDPENHDAEAKRARVIDVNADSPAGTQEGDDYVNPLRVNCVHEVSFPPGWNADEHPTLPPPSKPAKVYPFTLDAFQREAIAGLEQGHSVLVSAHTSAGKTVVAEYAIAMSLRDKQRVVYTSPLKALSNQKYRELYEEFQDVGLMTGDVTINPNASCIVMTTEILRSMLYRGSEVLREVAWVIFDEIHYMRDKERGVVWEESIILLPDALRMVFLSATIPNAVEFADWIARMKNQPCDIVYTDYRPVPLQHYIFPTGGNGLYLVVDEKGNFREDNFQTALTQLTGVAEGSLEKGKKRVVKKGPSDIFKIVKLIMERNYDPVIVFAFSRKECEALALQMSKLDFNTEDEKKLVEAVYTNAIDSLSDEDKKLPQVEHILPLLKRGIGIHHSGLLPLLKEAIEILFQEGLIKGLFATETFSMGLNMPAKTCVFTNVRKFDGENFRWISSGEYIQMSGRAGRRGIDDRGVIILMVDEKMEPAVAKNMLKGQPDPLVSTFHLGYNMLLNLFRVEGVNPEDMLKNSFHQFQNDRAVPEMKKLLEDLGAQMNAISIREEETVAEYHRLKNLVERLRGEMRETVNQAIHVLPFLQPGRLVRVRDGVSEWDWGVVINFSKKAKGDKGPSRNLDVKEYVLDVLLHCYAGGTSGAPRPPADNEQSVMQVVPVDLRLLDGLSSVRIYIPRDLRSAESRESVASSLREVKKRFPDGIPFLDPIEDMQIEDESFKEIVRRLETLEDRLSKNPLFKVEDMPERYAAYQRKVGLGDQMKAIRRQVKKSEDIILKDDLKRMKRVMLRLGYIDADNVVQLKGRVACEINTADELLITELMFNGVFNDLSLEQTAALLSCLVFSEKGDSQKVSHKEELQTPLRQLHECARRIAKVSQESKIPIDPDEYVQSFRPHMMEVVYVWSKGARFWEICKMTDIFEGSIIRAIRRLEELLRQLSNSAKSIGNEELETKFTEAITKIKRDIVFANSLYL